MAHAIGRVEALNRAGRLIPAHSSARCGPLPGHREGDDVTTDATIPSDPAYIGYDSAAHVSMAARRVCAPRVRGTHARERPSRSPRDPGSSLL